jgi:hypothetical protein
MTQPCSLNRRAIIAGGLCAGLWPSWSYAFDVATVLPKAQKIGSGRYSTLGISVFDATLYAPGAKYAANAPFALRLEYLRTFKGKLIVDYSVKEIRKQGFDDAAKLSAWEARMTEIFPNVAKGSNIVGLRTAAGHAQFFHNGRDIGTVKDEAFTRYFFNIWLGPKSSSPGLRQKLLGQ